MVPSLFPDWFGGEEGGGCLGRSAQSDRYTERRQLDLCCLDDVDARQNACWRFACLCTFKVIFSRSTLCREATVNELAACGLDSFVAELLVLSAQFVGVRAERQAGARRERTRQANSTGNGEDPQAKPAFVLRPTCSPPLTFEPQYIPTKCKACRYTLTASGGCLPHP